MFEKLKRKTPVTGQHPGPSVQDMPDNPTDTKSALATVAWWVARMVGPIDLWLMPQLIYIAEGTDAADRAGRLDAGSEPFDKFTTKPRLSLQHAIAPTLKGLLDLIGVRAHDILAAYKRGTLTTRPMPILRLVWYKAISPLTWLLLAVGALIEMWLGARLWERLISADDWWSWLVGLVWGLVIAAGMIVIARMMWEHRPGLLEERGLMIAFGLAALFGFGLAVYAFALAGGAETSTTGGIEGGGTAGSDSADDVLGVNWVFMAVYFGAMAFIGAMLVFAHFRDMSQESKDRQRTKREAWSHVISPEDQEKLAIELLEACLTLVSQAKKVIQSLAGTYVGGARMTLSPELNSMWDSTELENLIIEDPAWMAEIQREVAQLRRRVERREGDDDVSTLRAMS